MFRKGAEMEELDTLSAPVILSVREEKRVEEDRDALETSIFPEADTVQPDVAAQTREEDGSTHTLL